MSEKTIKHINEMVEDYAVSLIAKHRLTPNDLKVQPFHLTKSQKGGGGVYKRQEQQLEDLENWMGPAVQVINYK